MKKIVLFMLIGVLLTSCREYDINEILLGSTEVSLSMKGKVQYTFNPGTGQAAFSPDGTLYRYTDDNLQNWFELKCQTRPVLEGDKIKADLKWNSKTSSGDETALEFSVERTDESGMIWLWNETKNIGLIIKDF